MPPAREDNRPGGGTHLYTIKEEDEGDQGMPDGEDKSYSQDSEGFVAPAPVKPKRATFTRFFERNDFVFKPLEVTSGQKIRFVHEATMPASLSRREEIRRIQRQAFIEKKVQQSRSNVTLLRQYRVGELPDIQIDFKDVLGPLMAIVRADQSLATEIFVEVFQEIYKEQKDKESREQLGLGLHRILSSSKQYDYSAINCVHRIAMELLKIDSYTLDPQIIERTGQHSMNFQTSLILLEETLIRGDMSKIVGSEQQRIESRSRQKRQVGIMPSNDNGSITTVNRQYWFKLIKLYEIVGNLDALHGIWCQLAQQDGVMFRSIEGDKAGGGERGRDDLDLDLADQNRDPNAAATA
jgi:DNA-dependent protein kinase catalytic subunit